MFEYLRGPRPSGDFGVWKRGPRHGWRLVAACPSPDAAAAAERLLDGTVEINERYARVLGFRPRDPNAAPPVVMPREPRR